MAHKVYANGTEVAVRATVGQRRLGVVDGHAVVKTDTGARTVYKVHRYYIAPSLDNDENFEWLRPDQLIVVDEVDVKVNEVYLTEAGARLTILAVGERVEFSVVYLAAERVETRSLSLAVVQKNIALGQWIKKA